MCPQSYNQHGYFQECVYVKIPLRHTVAYHVAKKAGAPYH